MIKIESEVEVESEIESEVEIKRELDMKQQKLVIGILCAAVCETLFGFSYLFTKQVTNTVSPLTLLSWRFLIAFAVLSICILLGLIRVDFRGKPWKMLLGVAMFQPVFYFIGETIGISRTTASESGTVIACVPIVALILSSFLLKEKPRLLQAAGVGITAIGVAAIVLKKGAEATFDPLGYIMLLFAVVSYGLYSIFAQKTVQYTDIEKTYGMITLGAIVFTALALVENGINGTIGQWIALPFTSPSFLIAVLYLGIVSSVAAFFLYNAAISRIGTNRTASFVGISTVVTVVSGVLLLNEAFSLQQGIGTALVICGIYLANYGVREDA